MHPVLRAWKKNSYYILCHKQREKVTSGPQQRCMTGSSNNTQVGWQLESSNCILIYTARDEIPTQNKATLKVTGCSRPLAGLIPNIPKNEGSTTCLGPAPVFDLPLVFHWNFPLLQVVDQLRPLHKSPDASELPLLQCSCSKHRLKTQAWFWNYIIQEHRRGPAVQSAIVQRAVRKGWSSFKQLGLQQQQYIGF